MLRAGKMPVHKSSESGFTLVELLVVVLIIGVLTAIAIPAFMNQRQRANDASVESDVRNIAMRLHDAEITCPQATGYYIRGVDGSVLTGFSWTKRDGTVVGPIAANTHTVSADYIENIKPVRLELRETAAVSSVCATYDNLSLSEGTIVHVTYVGTTNGNGMKTGEFAVYGWNPNGAEYNGDTVSFASNRGELSAQEESSVYVYKSQAGGSTGN